MFLKRFYDEKLAQASYLVGCQATGEALVVDPNRHADAYIDAAARHGLRITHVTETHIHADFVSGTRELAAKTGATMHLSDAGGAEWRYAFADDPGVVLLRDGDHFRVGNLRLDVMHTPGHTPEHLTFLLTDTAAADRPMGAFTGDFIFVGDVGRPDLLERAAGVAGSMRGAARALFDSLRTFAELPDYLQLWPGHGAGSACGRALGAVPQSTLGYEKLFNWAFSHDDAEAFAAAVLEGQPDPPRYFAEMKRVNREGPPVLGGIEPPARLPDAQLAAVLDEGALVVDIRPADDYAAGHVPGTINIPLNRSFGTWAGWLVPYDRPFYLLIDDVRCTTCADEAARDLALIGLDRVAGRFGAGALEAWRSAAGRPLSSTPQTTPADLAARLADGAVTVLDVRAADEWAAGHIPGSAAPAGGLHHIPLGRLVERLDEIPRDRPLIVHCQSGARSAIATSVLEANGIPGAINLRGGFAAWQAEGRPVERG
ncbi:MAG TPA: rhodanese-like domain-containing protein [Longimicrobiales bacterium]